MDVGSFYVKVTLPDLHGNSSTDSLLVTVSDSIAPALMFQPDTLILHGNPAADTLTFGRIDNGSSDNCGLDSALLNGASSLVFNCNQVGMHRIAVDLYDLQGNMSSDSVSVYVIDTVSPGYTVAPYTAMLTGDSAVVSRADFLSGVTGGCDTPSVAVLSDTVFYCNDIASNPQYILFTLTTTGSVLTDSVAITVADSTPPVLMLRQ